MTKVFPWESIFKEACSISKIDYTGRYFPFDSVDDLIYWYKVDLPRGRVNTRCADNPKVDRYLRKQYKKYNKICPPMKFNINRDDLYNELYTYYFRRRKDTEWAISASRKDCDELMRYDRVLEIIYQCHKHIDKDNDDSSLKTISNYLCKISNYNIYTQNIDSIMKLDLKDKFKFLKIDL